MSITDTTSWQAIHAAARDIYQTRQWAELDCAMRPGEPVLLTCQVPSGPVWVPTVRRRVGAADVLFSPYGYPGVVRAGDDPVAVGALVDVLTEQVRAADACALLVRLHPVHNANLPDIDLPYAATVTHGPCASIDLRDGSDAAWSAMRSRTRSYIRRGLREGFEARTDAWEEDFEGFQRAYDQSMDRHDADAVYRLDAEYWRRLRALAPDHVRLLTVRAPSGELAAGAIVTQYGGMANYHLGGTRSSFLDHHLLELLLWRAAEAVSPTCDLLHLGGGVGFRRDGLHQLKRGLGRVEHLGRTLRLIADPAAYEQLAGRNGPGVHAPHFPAQQV